MKEKTGGRRKRREGRKVEEKGRVCGKEGRRKRNADETIQRSTRRKEEGGSRRVEEIV